MSVLETQTLAENNQLLLRDYAATVPGLILSPNMEDSQMLSIRGVTTGGFSVLTPDYRSHRSDRGRSIKSVRESDDSVLAHGRLGRWYPQREIAPRCRRG